jgi:membrane associated rhomboid family serine protease
MKNEEGNVKRAFMGLRVYLGPMNLRADFLEPFFDLTVRYFPVILIAGLSSLCVSVGSNGLHLPMFGIEHDPDLRSILLHMFSHNGPEHFLGNYLGLFLYAGLFGLALSKNDMRETNGFFTGALFGVAGLSILLALFVVPNENGVTGISGVVNFLMGYFWVGVAPILLMTTDKLPKIKMFFRLDSIAKRSPSKIVGLFLIGTIAFHWATDDFAGLDPSGDNPVGNLYHLVGYLGGCIAGMILFKRWLGRAGASDQRLALRQSQGI